MAHGLDPARLSRQIDEIDVLNRGLSGITLLKGIEVDILEDGSLDLPDSILARLDVVIAAVHSKFDLSRAKQTERILKAMDNPLVNILAHPTGRLIDEREPYDVDMAKVIRKAQSSALSPGTERPSRAPRLARHLLPDGKGGRRAGVRKLRFAQRAPVR